MRLTADSLAAMIDQSKLPPSVTEQEVIEFCATVRKYRFGTAYVLPLHLKLMGEQLRGSGVKLGTGVSFPFGTCTTDVKLFECESVMRLGAQEVDVVTNMGLLRSGRDEPFVEELRALGGLTGDLPLKAILEVGHLSREDLARGTRLCCEAGVQYVKTGTGFGPRPATVDDIRAVKENLTGDTGIKVAGGIGDIDTLLTMLREGVDRFGVSRGEQIMDQFQEKYGGECEV
jgi:deoxyribose-phosphate aldolase